MSTVSNTQSVTNAVTAEDLFGMNHGSQNFELVGGVLRELSLKGFQHGAIVNQMSCLLGGFVDHYKLGVVLGAATGFILSRGPDTVRGPDVSFVCRERIQRIGVPTTFFPEAPDFAVEVVSPGDRVTEVEAKAEDWLNGGTRLLWIVSPRSRTVTVYQSLSNIAVLTENDILDGGTVVPGFSRPVGDLFQPFFPGNPPN